MQQQILVVDSRTGKVLKSFDLDEQQIIQVSSHELHQNPEEQKLRKSEETWTSRWSQPRPLTSSQQNGAKNGSVIYMKAILFC
jgi:hypothetical protein